MPPCYRCRRLNVSGRHVPSADPKAWADVGLEGVPSQNLMGVRCRLETGGGRG